jgi:hypothetical protein
MATLTCGYDVAGNAKTYTTWATAFAAASNGDTIEMYYADTRKGVIYDVGDISQNKELTITGMIGNQQVWIAGASYAITMAASATYNNLTISGSASAVYGVAATSVVSTFNRCRLIGGRAVYIGGNTTNLNNCLCLAYQASIIAGATGVVNANFVTAIGGMGYGAGFFTYGAGITMTLKNCLVVCPTPSYSYLNIGGVITGSNNAGCDGTAANVGSGSVNTDTTDPKFYKDISTIFAGDDYRLDAGSSLATAGVAVSGITTDIYGRTRHATTPSIGCFEVWPLATTLDADEVQGGVTFIAPAGDSVEGTYTGIEPTDVPAQPVVSSVTATETTVAIAFTIATQTDTVYLRYRAVNGNGDWSAESNTLKDVGDGTITVADLDPSVRYEFILYGKRAGFAGPWSVPVFAECMTIGSGLPTYFDQAMLAAMAEKVDAIDTTTAGIADDMPTTAEITAAVWSAASTTLAQIEDIYQFAGYDTANPVVATGDGISTKTLTVDGMTVTITPDGITRT